MEGFEGKVQLVRQVADLEASDRLLKLVTEDLLFAAEAMKHIRSAT